MWERDREGGASMYPRTTAEMNVPAKAKVRITPKFRKKFSCGRVGTDAGKDEGESVSSSTPSLLLCLVRASPKKCIERRTCLS